MTAEADIREMRGDLKLIGTQVAKNTQQLENGPQFRIDLDSLKERTSSTRAGPRLTSLEATMTEVSEALIGQTHNIGALTAAHASTQVEQERRHEEILTVMREERSAEHELKVATVAAEATKWETLKDPKVMVISAVVLIAVLAPEALPIVLQYGGQMLGLGAHEAPPAIEASELPATEPTIAPRD